MHVKIVHIGANVGNSTNDVCQCLRIAGKNVQGFTHKSRTVRKLATFRQVKTGWRAEISRKGIRKSKVLPTKGAARDWAARQEYLILNGDKAAASLTFGALMDRYAREVSPGKGGHRWEVLRLEKIGRDAIASVRLGDLSAAHFSDWRDRRLREVSPGSVLREMVLMSAVLTQARREWGLIRVSPLQDVRKPSSPPARDRLPVADEMQRLAHSAGDDLSKATARAWHAFLFACETAMRAGEIVRLTRDRMDLARRVVRVDTSKNGTGRDVPLSLEAVRLIEALPEADPVFGLSGRQLDVLWRKLRDRAGVVDLTFHDTRHVAITRLSQKLDVLALARAVGHRDIRELMTYYNESAESLARRLD